MKTWRLLREVDDDYVFPGEVVAMLDERQNLIRVHRNWWRDQHPAVQRTVWRMDVPLLFVSDLTRLRTSGLLPDY